MPKTSFYSGTGITSEKADAVESSANAAAQSAADAATSETNAATSEANALTSKTNAASSASNALTSETNASSSAASALTSESNAATSEANALASATAAQNLEITSASFDTADGTLTLTKANSGTVTTDLDGRFLTSYTEANNLSTAVTWDDVPDDYITESSVTQHQSAINAGVSITESQISDLQSYLTAETSHADVLVDGDFTSNGLMKRDGVGAYSVDSSTYATETYVDTAVSGLVDSAPATLDTLNELASALGDDANFSTTVTNSLSDKANLSGASFTGNVSSTGDISANDFTSTTGFSSQYGGISSQGGNFVTSSGDITTSTGTVSGATVSATNTVSGSTISGSTFSCSGSMGLVGNISVGGTVDGRDVATDGTKLDGIEASADVTDTVNVTAAGALMDSEVTNLAQVKAFDSSDYATAAQGTSADTAYSWGDHDAVGYLTTHQDISGKANLSGATFTGGVSIGILPSGTANLSVTGIAYLYGGASVTGDITVTGTVDGRDVATDGARLDTIPYHRVKHTQLRADNQAYALNTSYNNVGLYDTIVHPATPVECARYLDLDIAIKWYYVSSNTNDLFLQLQMTVPTGGGTVTNMGTATKESTYNPEYNGYSNFAWYYVSGDYTHLFTEFGRINTGTGTSEGIITAWKYDSVNNRTYLMTYDNPGVSFNTGDTFYYSPYAFESAGATLTVTKEVDERYVSVGAQPHSFKFKTSYDDAALSYTLKMKEYTTADSGQVLGTTVTFTDVEEL
jgi:hypothetical protein